MITIADLDPWTTEAHRGHAIALRLLDLTDDGTLSQRPRLYNPTGHVPHWSATVADPDSWEDIALVNDNGLNVRITIPVEPGYRFFRLRPSQH